MQIIPVVDIRRGQVVHARGGERELYQPIQSVLTKQVAPAKVIQDLLAWYGFKIIYIADLDAIESGQLNSSLYQQISKEFPQLTIWLDAGIQTKQDLTVLIPLANVFPIIASESLTDETVLFDNNYRQRSILSLDKKGDEVLTHLDLFEDISSWPEHVIAMQLANVGTNNGPAYEWISYIQQKSSKAKVYAAGGVRGMEDIKQLKQKGVAGALVASALHKGAIDKEALDVLLNQK